MKEEEVEQKGTRRSVQEKGVGGKGREGTRAEKKNNLRFWGGRLCPHAPRVWVASLPAGKGRKGREEGVGRKGMSKVKKEGAREGRTTPCGNPSHGRVTPAQQ